jgi:uncharacterized protein
MKKILLPLIIFTLSFYCNAQTNSKITIGLMDNIHSKILNERRDFWVYVPESDQNGKPSKQRYPVIYLLDGDTYFHSVVGLTHHLGINAIAPEMIIVGIVNTDRTRDLTPAFADSNPLSKDSSLRQYSGGGDKFMAFIEKELMPHIDSVYPTEPYKMFIGHSLGGLTVMNTLMYHPGLFNSYVAIDPSMMDDNKTLLHASKTILATKNFSGNSLFLGIANTMGIGMDTIKVKTETDRSTDHIRAILELSKNISGNSQNKLKYKDKYYNEESHNSVPLIATYDALHFIFDFYELKIPRSELMGINMEIIAKIKKHYENASKQLGYPVKMPQPMANNLGYLSLRIKHYDEAEYLFKLNCTNFPETADVYDSLGDLYVARGDKVNAVSNYHKALSINEVAETRQKLESLQRE